MSDPDDNLPPQTSKFFDIIPANKRSKASPTSRPLIANNNPAQTDSMINTDQQPDPIEVAPIEPDEPEQIPEADNQSTEVLDDKEIKAVPAPVQTDIEQSEPESPAPVEEQSETSKPEEDSPPPVQTDIEQAPPAEEPQEEELLLPAEATPDDTNDGQAMVIQSPENSKSFRLRTWLIVLLFVIIIAVIGLVLYLFVFKSSVTNTPGTQFFGS